jgi:hypothetical protein
MYETPQTFGCRAAIIDLLKRSLGSPLTRRQLLDTAAQELDVSTEEVARALQELQVEEHVATVVVDGEERLKLAPVAQ